MSFEKLPLGKLPMEKYLTPWLLLEKQIWIFDSGFNIYISHFVSDLVTETIIHDPGDIPCEM